MGHYGTEVDLKIADANNTNQFFKSSLSSLKKFTSEEVTSGMKYKLRKVSLEWKNL